MINDDIYMEALRHIDERRRKARLSQEQRAEEIREKLPQTAELERQLQSVCVSIIRGCAQPGRGEWLQSIRERSEEAARMLRAILVSGGYPEDYLDVHYTCPLCCDSGFVDGKRCECLTKEIGKVASERINRESRLKLCGFENFRLDCYEDLPRQQRDKMIENYEYCVNYAETFAPDISPSVLMVGGTGVGKTHLSLAIAAKLLQKGVSVIYDSTGSLLEQLHREHFGESKDSGTSTLRTLLECDLLILDDFGAEFRTEFNDAMLYTILNTRLNACSPTIVSTNIGSSDMEQNYDDRLTSRLYSSKVLNFPAKDYRMLRARQTGGKI